jgi:hypothetical protein
LLLIPRHVENPAKKNLGESVAIVVHEKAFRRKRHVPTPEASKTVAGGASAATPPEPFVKIAFHTGGVAENNQFINLSG